MPDIAALTELYDPLVFGANADKGLVAVEHVDPKSSTDNMALFFRDREGVRQQHDSFEPFLVARDDVLTDCPVSCRAEPLGGVGVLNLRAYFPSWAAYQKAKSWLTQATGFSASAPGAPFYCINDPVQQYLMTSGRTFFLGMGFDELVRMQVDIECFTTEGYAFCNPEREGDSIIAIAMGDQTGWTRVLSAKDMSEEEMLRTFVETLRERDPDVIEGHNIFNFDLPYIAARAKRHKVKLSVGRDGSVPKHRSSRMNVGERTLSYERFDIFGRHVIDTLFLVHAYDVSHRSLSGFGLKEVAVHFGIAPEDRTYIEGSEIAATFTEDPDKVLRYVCDDIRETCALSALLSRSAFLQTQMIPYSYQSACVRGNATKIDALMVREYLRQTTALPCPDQARAFTGGYTDMFREGIIQTVHHCDVRSLYPSLMLTGKLAPASDELGAFLKLLDVLREFRLKAKAQGRDCGDEAEAVFYDALQSTFKVLINSFYGYLGFGQGRFNDFDAAEAVTGRGRDLLHDMITWLREHDAEPVEIDTDGIYFVPPFDDAEERDVFRAAFTASLPAGIEIEFDGEYVSMYSYKMKNYALLSTTGEIVIKGAALKSRGLEPFQRDFLKELIRLRLQDHEKDLAELRSHYETAIREREWPIARLAKTESLQESPASYASKRAKGKTSRRAVYELALRSEREYRAGDQVSYYVTGTKKSVAVHEAARLVTEWDADHRDENVPYYVAKLDALWKKFAPDDTQAELDFG